MESLLGPLLPLFQRERAAGHALALGVLLQTEGSTYRKAGALMLIAANGDYAGLLSGGCLEGDLAEHARAVIDTGQAHLLTYDMRGGDDLIWGLGLGCEGAMHILLLRVGPDSHWQPLAHFARCLDANESTSVGIVVESERADLAPGTVVLPRLGAAASMPALQAVLDEAARGGRVSWFEAAAPRCKVFALPLARPPNILLLGAGPDAAPVVDLAVRLSWKVTLADHRPAYADASHFPGAECVVQTAADELLRAIDSRRYTAAVVMSHHLPSDLSYLRALASTSIPYIGLLGPSIRRERLLADLGADAERIRPRLHAPVGLALGGRSPESIALAIVAEIHAFLHAGQARPAGAELPTRPVRSQTA